MSDENEEDESKPITPEQWLENLGETISDAVIVLLIWIFGTIFILFVPGVMEFIMNLIIHIV